LNPVSVSAWALAVRVIANWTLRRLGLRRPIALTAHPQS
jgi:hypothetical protein